MKKKAVVFWITAASVAVISTVLYIRSLLADKEELQKELKDHNNDDMDISAKIKLSQLREK